MRREEMHGEQRETGADMHVRFACNVIAAPVYPRFSLLTTPHSRDNSSSLRGGIPSVSEVRPRHQLSELRLEGGLPSQSVMPASGSALSGDPLHTSLRKTRPVNAL